jgi:monoamine oxidase
MRSLFARLSRRYGTKITGQERQVFVTKLVEQEKKELSEARKAKPVPAGRAPPRVVIIGAGFAGLMAGYTLAQGHQFRVTIFEARDRVGGRVWSKSKSSGIVEAGAELIGYNHPIWMHLGREFELGFSVNTSDTNFDALHLAMPLYLAGRRVPKRQLEGLYDKMDEALARMVQQAQRINPKHPWTARRAQKLDDMSVADWIDRLRFKGRRPKARIRQGLRQQFTNDGGRPCNKQSYLANLAVIAGGAQPGHPDAFFTQSENLRCSSGNQSLAERLVQEIKDNGGVIHTLSPADAIHIDEDRVTIDVEGRGPEDAEYVILAIPPSLWPRGKFPRLRITPELPRDYYVTLGDAVKYLSPLKSRFWINDGLAPTATSSSFGVTWEGTDNQIAPPGRDVELSLFAGDRPARRALNEWNSGGQKAVDDFYAAHIGKVYKEYSDNLSQQPEFMAWPEDPWTGGGYSCLAPGEVCRAGPLLQKAFSKRMFFAGEHTCFAYMGYMEGALQSGKKAAQSIIKATEHDAGHRRRSTRRKRARSRR